VDNNNASAAAEAVLWEMMIFDCAQQYNDPTKKKYVRCGSFRSVPLSVNVFQYTNPETTVIMIIEPARIVVFSDL
jgi:hypothetical protein